MDLGRGVLAGFLAGVAFIAINSWFATTMGKPALAPFQAIASLAQGPQSAMHHTAVIWYGMAIHSILSAVFGVIFVLLIRPLGHHPGQVSTAGFVYGGIIYVVDFVILAPLVPQFHALTMTNQPLELAVHLVFGSLLALLTMTKPRPPARHPHHDAAAQQPVHSNE